MKKSPFGAFVHKEFFHILRDKRTTLILLIMPVVLIFLLGFAISMDVRNVKVAYMDQSNDKALVEKIMARIDASEYFTVTGRCYGMDQLDLQMKASKVDAALRFDSGQQLQVVVDASNPNLGLSYAMYLKSIVMQQLAEEGNATVSGGEAPIVRMLYNPRMQSSYNFVPGILGLILILICAMMTSISIVREKETGTVEVLLSSPVRPLAVIAAKMVPYFVLSCVNIATILLLARFVMHVPMSGSLALIVLYSLVYTIMSLALGLLISTLTKSQTTALIISAIALMIPVMMLSGMLFPIDSMPGFFRALSMIIPARWFIDAMRKLMIEGLGFAYVLQDLLVLTAMMLIFMSVALKKFNDRLE